MKALPPYLQEVLETISHNQGEDINFALGYLGSNRSSYLSRLKSLGLAYTHRANRKTEVWLTQDGWKHIK